MASEAKLGTNYTGAQMSPQDTERMVEAIKLFPADILGDDAVLSAVREQYVSEAERIGSVPIPGSAKGMLKTGFDKMLGRMPEMLVDKLGERLAFERTGVRLYDAMIAKVNTLGSSNAELLPMLGRIRQQEAEHMDLVRQAMEQLGADPTAMTPCADVSGVLSGGILQVISDPRTNLAQSFEALLTAELTDNAAWEMLIDLVRQEGKDDMAASFQQALMQEEEHLQIVKSHLHRLMLS